VKIRFSPMVSEASGSAGPIVASKWKGISYFRERITPANPKSDEQVAQRAIVTRVNAWWHDIEEQLADCIKALAVGMPYSGFNAFSKRNIKDMATWLVTKKQPVPTDVQPRVMPLNAPTNPMTTLVLTTGATTKLIDATWSQAEASATAKIYVLAGETPDLLTFPANLFVQEKDTTLCSAEQADLTMPKAAQNYWVALLAEEPATSKFSIAIADWCLSAT